MAINPISTHHILHDINAKQFPMPVHRDEHAAASHP
jgi:hypothetical protein